MAAVCIGGPKGLVSVLYSYWQAVWPSQVAAVQLDMASLARMLCSTDVSSFGKCETMISFRMLTSHAVSVLTRTILQKMPPKVCTALGTASPKVARKF
eukprot:643962-Amphidinium_carterae.1